MNFDTIFNKKMRLYTETVGSTPNSPQISGNTGAQNTQTNANPNPANVQPQQNNKPQQVIKPDMNKIQQSLDYIKQFAQHPDVTLLLKKYMDQSQQPVNTNPNTNTQPTVQI